MHIPNNWIIQPLLIRKIVNMARSPSENRSIFQFQFEPITDERLRLFGPREELIAHELDEERFERAKQHLKTLRLTIPATKVTLDEVRDHLRVLDGKVEEAKDRELRAKMKIDTVRTALDVAKSDLEVLRVEEQPARGHAKPQKRKLAAALQKVGRQRVRFAKAQEVFKEEEKKVKRLVQECGKLRQQEARLVQDIDSAEERLLACEAEEIRSEAAAKASRRRLHEAINISEDRVFAFQLQAQLQARPEKAVGINEGVQDQANVVEQNQEENAEQEQEEDTDQDQEEGAEPA